MKKRHGIEGTCLILILSVILSACTGAKSEIIENKCSSCHTAAHVYQKKRPMPEWDRLLYGMKVRGLKVTPQEEKEIRAVLLKHYSTE